MQEAKQQVSPWLTQYAETSASYGSGRASRNGGSKFGGHDFRNATSVGGVRDFYPNSYSDQGGSAYYLASYENQVAFGEPYVAAPGVFTSIYTADAGFSAAGADSYAVGAYGHGLLPIVACSKRIWIDNSLEDGGFIL